MFSTYVQPRAHVFGARQVEEAYQQLDEMRLDIESKNTDIARLDDLKDEVSRFLLTAADDLKNQLAKTQPDGSWIEESAIPALNVDGSWQPVRATVQASLVGPRQLRQKCMFWFMPCALLC